MTLIINNDDVRRLLTMADTIDALEGAYRELARGEAVCRPRIDIQIPTGDPRKIYRWGTMEGGSTSGYFAIRMKSDIMYDADYEGVHTEEKYCIEPGTFCGLILLTSVQNGEPLAFINDGVIQHMRTGADSGIGAKIMSREDSSVVGMLGSGGMARSHMEAFMAVRDIRKLKVFSPTKANREAFAGKMERKFDIEAEALDDPRGVYEGVDILAGCTDSAKPVITNADWIEDGTHVTNVGAGGLPGQDVLDRVDVYLRFGTAPAPLGLAHMNFPDEHLTYAARSDAGQNFLLDRLKGKRAHGVGVADRVVYLGDLMSGTKSGRTSPDQVTYSERGNLQGIQFYAVAGRVYDLARENGMGREIPTEWFTQDVRD